MKNKSFIVVVMAVMISGNMFGSNEKNYGEIVKTAELPEHIRKKVEKLERKISKTTKKIELLSLNNEEEKKINKKRKKIETYYGRINRLKKTHYKTQFIREKYKEEEEEEEEEVKKNKTGFKNESIRPFLGFNLSEPK